MFSAGASPAGAADCGRECLRGFLTEYLNAMGAHNPGVLPLASNVRFTEDARETKLGDGLWKGASKMGAYRQDTLEVRQGVAASQAIVEEAGAPGMLALRLKIADQKISEVETQVPRNRSEGAIFTSTRSKRPARR